MRKSPLSLCVFAVAVSFFVGTVLDVGYYHIAGPGLWHPTIACREPVQHLGKVEVDKEWPCEFVVENTGSRPLIIRQVKPGCGKCIRVVCIPAEAIQPGREAVIRVALETKDLRGVVRKTFMVISNDPIQTALVLTIHADVEGTNCQTERAASISSNPSVAHKVD